MFAREPHGALVNASCALAAKHNKTIRVARLLDAPDADPQQSTAQQFFNRACLQLANTTTRASDMGAATPSAGYSASDALASLHLVAYFSLQGGTGDWQVHLDMARDWLAQTDLCAPENEAPKEALALMDEAEQLAAKMIIVSSLFLVSISNPRLCCSCRSFRLAMRCCFRADADHLVVRRLRGDLSTTVTTFPRDVPPTLRQLGLT